MSKTRNRIHRRFDYNSLNNNNRAAFKYCSKSKQWVFLRDKDSDPCNFGAGQNLAQCSSTAFDIAYDFDKDWVDPYNKRLDLYFFENDDNSKDPERFACDAAIGWHDGICNPELNKRETRYDGGDCCAETCRFVNCGLVIDEVFGVQNDAPVFPYCKEFPMWDLSITLQDFEYYNVTDGSEFEVDFVKIFSNSSGSNIKLECNQRTFFSVDINETMKNKTYVAKVNENAHCVISIRMFEPILKIDTDHLFSIESGIIVTKETINVFPTSIGSFENFATDERMMRINLTGRELQGTIPKYIGLLHDRLEVLDLGNNSLIGTIPAEVGQLTSLKVLKLDGNKLGGTIPTIPGEGSIEMHNILSNGSHNFSVYNLEVLDLGNNNLRGKIPIELRNLRSLKELRLDHNRLNGAIPGEIFIRTEENNIGQTWEVIDLSHNELTGAIPKEISILRNLTHLILDNNADLTGDISCSLLSELVEDINVCQPINHADESIVNNTVNGGKGSIDNNTNGNSSIGAGLTPGIIATIAVVASCVLLL